MRIKPEIKEEPQPEIVEDEFVGPVDDMPEYMFDQVDFDMMEYVFSPRPPQADQGKRTCSAESQGTTSGLDWRRQSILSIDWRSIRDYWLESHFREDA